MLDKVQTHQCGVKDFGDWAPAFFPFIPVLSINAWPKSPGCPELPATPKCVHCFTQPSLAYVAACVSSSKAGSDWLVFGFPTPSEVLYRYSICLMNFVEWEDE